MMSMNEISRMYFSFDKPKKDDHIVLTNIGGLDVCIIRKIILNSSNIKYSNTVQSIEGERERERS